MARGFFVTYAEGNMLWEALNRSFFAMSMQSVASPAAAFVGPPKRAALAHIPGDEGWPIIGRTLAVLADPKGEVERMAAKYGMVYRTMVLGETSLSALGPEANELLL